MSPDPTLLLEVVKKMRQVLIQEATTHHDCATAVPELSSWNLSTLARQVF